MIVEVYTDASVKEEAYTISYQIYSDKYSAICRKYFEKSYDNNIAEMLAIVYALKHLSFLNRSRGFDIVLYTDNKNAIEIMRREITSHKYVFLKKSLLGLLDSFKSCEFVHIKAHTKNEDIHSKRNCMADKLCKESLTQKNSKFYLLYNCNSKKHK